MLGLGCPLARHSSLTVEPLLTFMAMNYFFNEFEWIIFCLTVTVPLPGWSWWMWGGTSILTSCSTLTHASQGNISDQKYFRSQKYFREGLTLIFCDDFLFPNLEIIQFWVSNMGSIKVKKIFKSFNVSDHLKMNKLWNEISTFMN